MNLGYQNPFYLKQAQKKQQSLYDGKVLLEKHDPPVVHDSEETLQLAQESREKMKQLNKEIKPANYTKINHLSGVFVPQTALSREELYFSNNPKTANVSKSISIPNEDFSDETTPSVARKFLNKVKSTIVTLQRVVKQRMTIETHNWSSSAHQELHKIVRDEIFPIVNQVDARLQNFKIQFLKEAAKFVGDFKSLANETDASLAKHKASELEIKRLLKAVVSQDIMIIVQNEYVVDTSDLQTELERTKERFENCIIKKESEYAKLWNDWYKQCGECKYDKISYDKAYKDMQQKIERLQAQLGDLKGKSKDTSSVSDTRNPLSQKLENENVKLEFQVISPGMFRINLSKTSREEKHVPNKVSASNRTKPITVSQPPVITKKDVNSELNGLSSTGVDNTKTRRPQHRSNTKHDRVPSASKSSRSKNKKDEVEEHHRNLLLSKNNKHISSACNNIKIESQDVISKVIQICLWCIDPGCSKHMTRNLKLLINFVWKFMGTVRFGNDHVAAILGFGDLQWGNILITRVYFVEGLGHNLFSVGQFCDSDLEVAFRRDACFVRNLEGVDLLKGDRSTNLYTINLHEMASASPICLMARASSTKSWLWHQRLSHLNFDTINDLARNDLVVGVLKFKYHKEHLYPSCEQGKSKRASHPPKPVPNSRIMVLLQSPVIIIRTDNGTKFKNQVLKEYFDTVGISHQMSYVRTLQQNGVVEQRNRTFVEAARTIKPDISFLHVFGALCYPKNDHEDIGKLGAKGDIGFFIGSKPRLQSMTSGQISSRLDLTYAPSTITMQQPTEEQVIGEPSRPVLTRNQLRSDGDMCIYALTVSTMEPKNVKEAMTDPAWIDSMQEEFLQFKRLDVWVSGLDLTYAPSTITTQQPSKGELLFEAMYDDYIGGQPSATARTVSPAQE
nr:retrovirus-related Pol polyprotein from transposon TNT 1-94 [Tanacetum cinerariifolium]